MSIKLYGKEYYAGYEVKTQIREKAQEQVQKYNKGELANKNSTGKELISINTINNFLKKYDSMGDTFGHGNHILTEDELTPIVNALTKAVDLDNFTNSEKGDKFTVIDNFDKSNALTPYLSVSQDVISLYDENGNGKIDKENGEWEKYATGGIGIKAAANNAVENFLSELKPKAYTDNDLKVLLGDTYNLFTPDEIKEYLEVANSTIEQTSNLVNAATILGETEEEINENLKLFSDEEKAELFSTELDVSKSEDVEKIRQIYEKLLTNKMDTHFDNLGGLDGDKTSVSANELRGELLAADCYEDGDFDGSITKNAWKSLSLGNNFSLVQQCYEYAEGKDAEKASAIDIETQMNEEIQKLTEDANKYISRKNLYYSNVFKNYNSSYNYNDSYNKYSINKKLKELIAATELKYENNPKYQEQMNAKISELEGTLESEEEKNTNLRKTSYFNTGIDITSRKQAISNATSLKMKKQMLEKLITDVQAANRILQKFQFKNLKKATASIFPTNTTANTSTTLGTASTKNVF